MNEFEKQKLIEKAKEFFKKEIFDIHVENTKNKASLLDNYQVNPFLVKYLACFIDGVVNSTSIAKALVLPRVLGTSINTTFGSKVQKMISLLFEGEGSTTQGIDIEFIDAIDNRRKYCQIKSGPNTINKDDVKTISDHFAQIKNLARTNNLNINYNDLVVGILYGNKESLSTHYKNIKKDYPVYIGQEFWEHITGDKSFYDRLTDTISELANDYNGKRILKDTINSIKKEIDENSL